MLRKLREQNCQRILIVPMYPQYAASTTATATATDIIFTARLLALQLGLNPDQYAVSFQSRLGRDEWLQPYTSATLKQLGKQKLSRLDVICPGFVADCLETLEEIAQEGKEEFQHAGGGEYHYIPCLNDRDDWIYALTDLVEDNLQGWLVEPDAAELEQGWLRALAMGAGK